MTAHDLSALGAGFSDAALGSQSVFRAALHALSHPGRVVELPHDAQTPSRGHAASAAWLRFHTGCVLVDAPEAAQFAWVAQGDECPPLERFAQGSDAYPDQSATCVLDVAALGEGGAGAWTLRGPGIRDSASIAVQGLPSDADAAAFTSQWAANHAAFPRGIDVFLAAPKQIVGLPRTTRIEQEA